MNPHAAVITLSLLTIGCAATDKQSQTRASPFASLFPPDMTAASEEAVLSGPHVPGILLGVRVVGSPTHEDLRAIARVLSNYAHSPEQISVLAFRSPEVSSPLRSHAEVATVYFVDDRLVRFGRQQQGDWRLVGKGHYGFDWQTIDLER
jgi:hypothetical protein